MKKINTILAIIILILTQSCKKENECEGLECFTTPSPFGFELVDKLTGENLFTNGTFNPNDIKVINLDDQSNVEFTFIDENDYNIIQINTIGWKTETVNYSINISNKSVFKLFVNAERLNGECCDYTEYKEIRIENSEFELNQNSGIYKILVSQSYGEIGTNEILNASISSQFLSVIHNSSKSQFLISNSELISAGLQSGFEIIGIEWYVGTDNTPETSIFDLYITDDYIPNAMPSTGIDQFVNTVDTQVGNSLTDIGVYTGWHTANFTTSYIWDGTDNMILQICRTSGPQPGQDYIGAHNISDVVVSGHFNKVCDDLSGNISPVYRPFFRIIYINPR